MSYTTVTGNSPQDLEAQFRAFVLDEAQPPTAASPTLAAESRNAVRIPTERIARQATATISISSSSSSGGQEVVGDELLEMHFLVQCFVDHILVFVTEDASCAPGVMVRYDPFHNGDSHLLYGDEVPTTECTVLFGVRDHALTNLLASTVAHAIRNYGETRPLLMGISVMKTAKRLAGSTAQVKTAFLALVKTHVMDLAAAPA